MIKKLARRLLGLQGIDALALALCTTLPELTKAMELMREWTENQNKINEALATNQLTTSQAVVILTQRWKELAEKIADLEQMRISH